MKVSEKLALAERLAQEIANRYDWSQATHFLTAFYGDAHTYWNDYDSVREMASANLNQVDSSILGEMIDDLGLDAIGPVSNSIQRPEVWKDHEKFRLFLSHVASEKEKAKRLRDALAEYGVSAFVAHEDITPTLEWEVQIQRALHSMEAFVSIHTEGFTGRDWCQQEVGFAVAKGVKVMALRMGEDPTGFISKHQAISRGTKRAEAVAKEMAALLENDERTQIRFEASKSAFERENSSDDVPF